MLTRAQVTRRYLPKATSPVSSQVSASQMLASHGKIPRLCCRSWQTLLSRGNNFPTTIAMVIPKIISTVIPTVISTVIPMATSRDLRLGRR
jgi:hypothetical protein